MLIGTALLTAIDILVEQDLFGDDSTEVRNVDLILCHFLRFAHNHKDLCQKNENGWQDHVSTRARRHQVTLKGLYDIDKITVNLTSGAIIHLLQSDAGHMENVCNTRLTYESPRRSSGLVTLEILNAGTERTWRFIDWEFEVKPPCQSGFGERPLFELMRIPTASMLRGLLRCQSWHWSPIIWWKYWR